MFFYQAAALGTMIGVAISLLWVALEIKSEQCFIAFLIALQVLLLGMFLKD